MARSISRPRCSRRRKRRTRGNDLPRLRQRQRRAVHDREADQHGRRSRSRYPTPAATSMTRPESTDQKLTFIMDLKNVRRGRIAEYADKFKSAVYTPIDPRLASQPALESQSPVRVSRARPQNEINEQGRSQPAPRTASTSSPKARTCRRRIEGVNQFLDARNSLRSGQSGQRRRGRHLRSRDGAKQHAHFLDA